MKRNRQNYFKYNSWGHLKVRIIQKQNIKKTSCEGNSGPGLVWKITKVHKKCLARSVFQFKGRNINGTKTCPCFYDKSKISYKEGDVNRNAWSKIAEKLDFVENAYKYIHRKMIAVAKN